MRRCQRNSEHICPPSHSPCQTIADSFFFARGFASVLCLMRKINLSAAGSFQKDAVSAGERMQPKNRNILTR